MALTVLYRINGGEVIKITQKPQTFEDRNTTYWGVIIDPSFPDGIEIRDADENARVSGFAKFFDGTDTVRNATPAELDNFSVAENDDENSQDADAAIYLFQGHPRFRKMMIALVKGIIKQDNDNIIWIHNFMDAVEASNNLGDFKVRVAALDSPIERTFAEAKSYILNQVTRDD